MSELGRKGDYVLKLESPTTWRATAPCADIPARLAGYGSTEEQAIADMMAKPAFQDFLKHNKRRLPTLADFIIDQNEIRSEN